VALGVDVAFAVGESLGVAVWVAVALGVVDAWADAFPVGVLPPTDGVLTELPVWVDEPCGGACGVKIDGAEEGEPPVQAVIVIAMSMAPAVARATMSHARRDVPGWVATGMDRRTFMEPPRTRGGQWRRTSLGVDTVHSSICHRGRRRKSERADSRPAYASAAHFPALGTAS
jgi:hypothetical protein